LELWELSWEEFTRMPSRKSAEEVVQQERDTPSESLRERLLTDTLIKGFSNYAGIRISSTGKRFHIEDGILWNLLDEHNHWCGQAAVFSNCKFIAPCN
jgi:MEKHLA domain